MSFVQYMTKSTARTRIFDDRAGDFFFFLAGMTMGIEAQSTRAQQRRNHLGGRASKRAIT
jgi:hypothetical protein